jgi:hypothetical protein
MGMFDTLAQFVIDVFLIRWVSRGRQDGFKNEEGDESRYYGGAEIHSNKPLS